MLEQRGGPQGFALPRTGERRPIARTTPSLRSRMSSSSSSGLRRIGESSVTLCAWRRSRCEPSNAGLSEAGAA
jgi:hypothetical protein